MKLKFLKTANDKYTGFTYEAGKEYEFEEARAKEILAVKGYAEEVKETVVESLESKEVVEKTKKKKTTKTKKVN